MLFCFCFLCKTIKAFQKQQNVLDQNDLLLAEMSWCWIPVQLARQTACNPFCCDLGLDGTQTSPPPELWAHRRRVWAVIAEATLSGSLSGRGWLQELDGIWRPGPPLIIFKSASHWMPPLSLSLLTQAYLNMDRWSHSLVCHFYGHCNHTSITHYCWCQNSRWPEDVSSVCLQAVHQT